MKRSLFTLAAFITVVCGAVSASADESLTASAEDVIQIVGPTERIANGSVARNQAVLTFTYQFVQAGVLLNDVHGSGLLTRHTNYARAGSPGYMVGRYGPASGPIWCFFESGELDVGEAECFWMVDAASNVDAAIVVSWLPWLRHSVRWNADRPTQSNSPKIQETENVSEVHRNAEYRFIGWQRDAALLAFRDDVRERERISVAPDRNGDVIFRSVAGSLRFSRDDQGQTLVTRVD